MLFKKKKKPVSGSEKIRKFGKNLDFASVEAYNLLRTNLSFALPDKEGGRVIGVTSPCPQEGKSTTSLNLAFSLAEAGNSVLLMDADMRRPSLGRVVNVPRVPGLSNVLMDGNLEKAVHSGDFHKNLTVLLSGDIPPNPSELVASQKMKELVGELQKSYDYVIVDLPPVNLVADPIAISKYLDGMVIVVRHKHTRRRELIETIRQLELVGAKILGFVYNGMYKSKAHYKSSN